MAGLVLFHDDQAWSSRNWIYRGLLGHALAEYASADDRLAREIRLCMDIQSVLFPLLQERDAILAEQVRAALKKTARRCADGELLCSVEGRLLDDAGQLQFKEETARLVEMMEQS